LRADGLIEVTGSKVSYDLPTTVGYNALVTDAYPAALRALFAAAQCGP